VLPLIVFIRRQFVLLVRLPRETDRVVSDALVVDARAPIRIETVGDDVVVADVSIRSKKPELVLLDWASDRQVHVVDLAYCIGNLEASAEQAAKVVRLKRLVGVSQIRCAAVVIAALARNQVEMGATG